MIEVQRYKRIIIMLIRIILGIVIIAAIIDAGILASDYLDKKYATDAVNTQIESQNRNLAQLIKTNLDLKNEVNRDNASYQQIKTQSAGDTGLLSGIETNPNQILKLILGLAKDNRLKIVPLSTQEWSKSSIDNNALKELKISFSAEGQRQDVVNFIKLLPELHQSLVVESVSMKKITQGTRNQDNLTEDSLIVSSERVSAELALALYAR
jgi:hypothetical protein